MMTTLLKFRGYFCWSIGLFSFSGTLVEAADEKNVATTGDKAPWERHALDIETGLLWNVRSNTPINYRIVPTQLSWRSPYVKKKRFSNGTTVVIRNQASLIADWMVTGPEDYYFGVSGAPSLEWWMADDKWSIYAAIGGGFGVTNSQGVSGGQGQDFTYNWFAKSGVRVRVNTDVGVYGGLFFQHLSNRGATDPNPGIDALGFTVGVSYSF